MITKDIHIIIQRLTEKYGDDFNWFVPDNPKAFEAELQRELSKNHPLASLELKTLARNERNDDVLFTDNERLFVVHLTWSANEHSNSGNDYPRFFEVPKDDLQTFLETDFLEN